MTNIEILNQLKALENERIKLTAVKGIIVDQCTVGKPVSKSMVNQVKLNHLRKDLAFALKSPYSKYYEYQPLMDYLNDRLDVIVSIMSTLAHQINI